MSTRQPLGQRGAGRLPAVLAGFLPQQVAHLVPAAVTVGAQQLAACGALLLLALGTSEQVLWSGWWGGRQPCGRGRIAGVVTLAGRPHQLPPLHGGLFLTLGAHQDIATREAAGPGQTGTLCPGIVLLTTQVLRLAVAPPPPQLVQHAAQECCGASRGSADVLLVSRWRRGSPGISVSNIHLQQAGQSLFQCLKRLN